MQYNPESTTANEVYSGGGSSRQPTAAPVNTEYVAGVPQSAAAALQRTAAIVPRRNKTGDKAAAHNHGTGVVRR